MDGVTQTRIAGLFVVETLGTAVRVTRGGQAYTIPKAGGDVVLTVHATLSARAETSDESSQARAGPDLDALLQRKGPLDLSLLLSNTRTVPSRTHPAADLTCDAFIPCVVVVCASSVELVVWVVAWSRTALVGGECVVIPLSGVQSFCGCELVAWPRHGCPAGPSACVAIVCVARDGAVMGWAVPIDWHGSLPQSLEEAVGDADVPILLRQGGGSAPPSIFDALCSIGTARGDGEGVASPSLPEKQAKSAVLPPRGSLIAPIDPHISAVHKQAAGGAKADAAAPAEIASVGGPRISQAGLCRLAPRRPSARGGETREVGWPASHVLAVAAAPPSSGVRGVIVLVQQQQQHQVGGEEGGVAGPPVLGVVCLDAGARDADGSDGETPSTPTDGGIAPPLASAAAVSAATESAPSVTIDGAVAVAASLGLCAQQGEVPSGDAAWFAVVTSDAPPQQPPPAPIQPPAAAPASDLTSHVMIPGKMTGAAAPAACPLLHATTPPLVAAVPIHAATAPPLPPPVFVSAGLNMGRSRDPPPLWGARSRGADGDGGASGTATPGAPKESLFLIAEGASKSSAGRRGWGGISGAPAAPHPLLLLKPPAVAPAPQSAQSRQQQQQQRFSLRLFRAAPLLQPPCSWGVGQWALTEAAAVELGELAAAAAGLDGSYAEAVAGGPSASLAHAAEAGVVVASLGASLACFDDTSLQPLSRPAGLPPLTTAGAGTRRVSSGLSIRAVACISAGGVARAAIHAGPTPAGAAAAGRGSLRLVALAAGAVRESDRGDGPAAGLVALTLRLSLSDSEGTAALEQWVPLGGGKLEDRAAPAVELAPSAVQPPLLRVGRGGEAALAAAPSTATALTAAATDSAGLRAEALAAAAQAQATAALALAEAAAAAAAGGSDAAAASSSSSVADAVRGARTALSMAGAAVRLLMHGH